MNTDLLKNIELIILDVDGTMTDGSINIDNNGVEHKSFNVKDGFAIAKAIKYGVNVAIITGRSSKVVEVRAKELGIVDLHQGVKNKLVVLDQLLQKYSLTYDRIAFMGDDINDIPVAEKVAVFAAPSDAADEVFKLADFNSKYDGGKGAVREFVSEVLKARGIWDKIVDDYKKGNL